MLCSTPTNKRPLTCWLTCACCAGQIVGGILALGNVEYKENGEAAQLVSEELRCGHKLEGQIGGLLP